MPSDYTTLEAIKLTLNEVGTTDDAFLTALITRASRAIDTHCGRFFVGEAQTRYFDAIADIDGQILLLDEDLLSVTELTNGDGDVIASSDYVLLPSNHSPHYAIRLKASGSESWTYVDDPENAIVVNGTWGFSNGTPDDVEQACIRLVVFMYK
ncbi:MAG: phage gp6-like head-tail connector protein, partial [Anaerolineae bacterium]|nr:phage gp6-like head-tail connector protein [Anaerolineae bacterium]